MTVVAIDPGDVHVGWAEFEDGHCVLAVELTPEECIQELEQRMGELEAVVVEEFRLYPWTAQTQTWSDFPTAQLIGVIKYLHRSVGQAMQSGPEVELVMQQAAIKKPTTAQLKARGVKSKAKAAGAGGHALDAELHGYHYTYTQREKER